MWGCGGEGRPQPRHTVDECLHALHAAIAVCCIDGMAGWLRGVAHAPAYPDIPRQGSCPRLGCVTPPPPRGVVDVPCNCTHNLCEHRTSDRRRMAAWLWGAWLWRACSAECMEPVAQVQRELAFRSFLCHVAQKPTVTVTVGFREATTSRGRQRRAQLKWLSWPLHERWGMFGCVRLCPVYLTCSAHALPNAAYAPQACTGKGTYYWPLVGLQSACSTANCHVPTHMLTLRPHSMHTTPACCKPCMMC